MALAQLFSQAVDYPKNGVPVNAENMPRKVIHAKPDWKKVRPRSIDTSTTSAHGLSTQHRAARGRRLPSRRLLRVAARAREALQRDRY